MGSRRLFVLLASARSRAAYRPSLGARRLKGVLLAGLLFAAPAFAADPQIAAWTDTPDPVAAGGIITYSARIDNSSVDAATNVVVSVPLPSGATFVSATAPCAFTAGTVQCAIGSVAGNGTDTRQLAFVFRANGPGPTSVTAVATLTSDNDTNSANNVQSQTTTVNSGGDLALTKTASPSSVVGGANVTYTLTASNAGPNVSGDIVITDNLPPAVTFVSSSGSGWSCSVSASVATCTHPGPHAVNAAIPPLTLVGQVTASSGTITNSATVAPATGGTADPDTTNNTATVSTTVTTGADLRIAAKTVTSTVPGIAGQNVTFQIQPRNAGPATAVNAVVTDNLPAGWTYVSATGPNWTCSNAGQAVTCSRASFAVGATDNITVVAQAPNNSAVGPTGTSYTNTASIASDTPDPISGNNSGSVSINILPDGADLRIAKTKTPNPVAQGSPLTSTIRVTNNGPRVATGPLGVVEVLTGETFVSASGTGWTCAVNGSTVACTNTNSSGLAVGATLPNLVIVSTATVAGSATNNACTGSSLPSGATGFTASPPNEGDANNTNDCVSVTNSSTFIQPDLAIAKTTSTPTGGDKIVTTSEGSVTYTIVASNATSPGTDAATGVVFRDTVPAYLSGRTTINAVTATVSGGTATFACAISSATVTCTQNGGLLLPGQTVTVPITVNRPMQDGTFTNTATVANTVEGDPNATNNSASDTVQIDPIADVEVVSKTVTPTAVRAGETATYVISYRNNGPSSALLTSLTDVFTFAGGDPGANVLSITSSKPGSTCSIAAGAILAPGTNSYTCTLGTLTNGETRTITLVIRPRFQAGNAARTFANTASITTSTVENPAGGDNGNNSKSASLPVNPAQVDLLTNKTDLEDPVLFDGNAFLNYRVTVTNNGPSYATGVIVTEVMTPPAGRRIRFVCDTNGPSSAVCNAPSLCSTSNVTSAPGVAVPAFTCAVPAGTATTGPLQGELAANQLKTIFLRFEALDQPAAAGDTFNNVATVSANEPDSFPGNDSATEQTTLRQRIDLAVAKTSNLATVALHQPFTWTVTVTNNGPGNSLQTDLTDTLPAGVVTTGPITFSRTSPAGTGTCTSAASTVSCGLGLLNNGGIATISIPARIDTFPTGGTLTNNTTVDTDPNKIGGIDPVSSNNTASNTVSVTQSSIAGTVFQDVSRSGTDAGTPQAPSLEPRIAGVTVTLTGTDLFGNAVSLTTTTDASGNYLFGNLAPSNATGYVITETQPAGFVNSPASPPATGPGSPSAGGTYASGGSAGNSSFTAVVLAGSTVATDYNFPEVRQVALSGFVYVDANLNNVRDPGSDPPVANATVVLRNATTGAAIATVTTDTTGAYRFAGLDPFTPYTIEEPLPTAPAGLASGPVNPGLINGVACASGCTAQPNTPTPGSDRIAAIDLSSGFDGTLFNFGELQQSAITGTVYVDRNRNGTMDATPTDGRIAGVTVRLVQGATCATGTTLQTTTTATDGSYAFNAGIAGRSYLVCETQPVGYAQAVNNPGTGATVPNVDDTISIANLSSAGSTGNNFGERVGSISGTVYLDANNDGLRAGDTGIAAVTLTLTGVDATGAPVSRTTTTDANGAYRFDDLLTRGPGGYTITEQTAQPIVNGRTTINGKSTPGNTGGTGSDGNASPSTIAAIAFSANIDSLENNFGEILPSSIAGTVFLDPNDDGIQTLPGDAPLGGVTITLQGSDDTSTTINRTTTTAADGSYSFINLRPGLYQVIEPTQPSGTANGKTIAGSAGGTATPSTVTPSSVVSIALVPGTVATGYNFAEIGMSSRIAGRVYVDANNDGVVGATETGISNVTIQLAGTDFLGNAVSRTTVTDATGNYVFANLDAGTYRVLEPTQPPGTLNGITTAGSAGGTPTGVATTPSAIATIPLGVAQASTGNNFGEIAPASVVGRVYNDGNDNGVIDAGESGIGNVPVVLTGTDDQGNAVNLTVVSDANGNYAFPNLRPGTYTVTEPTQPTGTVNGVTSPGTIGGVASGNATPLLVTPSAIRGIALSPGAQSIANNFGEILPSSIAGTVFIDLNDDGLQTLPGDAPLGAVTLTLQGTDDTGTAISRTTTTAADGSYGFLNLRPGLYSLVEPTQPTGTTNGKTIAGSAGGTASLPNVTPSAVVGVALVPGTAATGYNFAEIANSSSIAGRVYLDANNDGLVAATETGIANVTIQLTGTDFSGAAVSRTTVTDATGNYAFANLGAGSYRVSEPTQPPGTLNGITSAGSAGGTPTSVGTTPSAIATIPLAVAQTSTGNNFGELVPASVAGRVFGDNNDNGMIDSGESGIGNVSLVLTGNDDQGNAVNVPVVSDAAGNYAFPNLRPGTYTITEPTQPAGTVNGITSAGTIAGVVSGNATARTVTPSAIGGIVLVPGAQSIANNFGEVGNSPDLLVTKASVEARFTVNNVGTYTIRVRNGGQAATVGAYRVTDRLPAGLTLDSPPTGTGWTCTGAAGASTFTCSAGDVLAANATNPNAITAKVRVGNAALAASPVDNAVLVEGGGELDARAPTQAERDAFNGNTAALAACVPGITQNACRTPTVIQASASISGTTWYDVGGTRDLLDAGDRRLPGWSVEVLDAAGTLVARTTTATDGTYRIADLVPGVPLTVRFRDPQSNIVWGYPVNGESAPGSSGATCNQAAATAGGAASSCPGAGVNPALTVVLASGQNLPQQSLPVDPSGVVYDAGTRQPVSGATVTLTPIGACSGWDPATSLVAAGLGGYSISGASASVTVGTDGFYQFLFSPSAPPRCSFGLTVVPPASYQFVSTLIPPATGPLDAPGAPGTSYPVEPQAGPPTGAVGPATLYFLSFIGGSSGPNVIHNHIPIDPAAATGLTISKTGDRQVVEVGDTIRYTITVSRNGGAVPRQVTVVDRLPAGFTFVAGTAVVNGVPTPDPAGKPGPRLAFNLGTMTTSGQLVLQYRARVGVGSQQGDGINRAIGYACGVPSGCVNVGLTPIQGSQSTNEAQYRVRVTGGVFTTDACMLGKVFVDCNGNHIQDPEELGIPGVRLVLSDGTNLISDSEGKYSMCGLAPRSHVLKIDPHTLPIGSHLTTSSNRNLGDAGSLWLDLKNGELFRADFIEGSCSNQVLEQVKARRAQGEIRNVETERGPALRFESKAHGLNTVTSPKEGTDSANQLVPKPRDPTSPAPAGGAP